MKNLMNKLIMVAVVAALVIAGYMIVQRQENVQSVQIQRSLKIKKEIDSKTNKAAGEDCDHDKQCQSGSCGENGFCS